MPSLSSLALALTLAGAGYLSAICVTPPNPAPPQSRAYKVDRIRLLTGIVPRSVAYISLGLFLYHALVAVAVQDDASNLERICPHPSNLDQSFFTWNAFTISSLAMIYLGAAVRLSAYGGLGKNFTFQLAPPDRLVTSGIYHFIQHPSYTGQFFITVGLNMLILRWDSAPACFFSESLLGMLAGWGKIAVIGAVAFTTWALVTRVGDEEGMLKQKFGQEWVRWHSSTARFIPYVL
ncbi:prenyl cysteine carboxyl methyltransferase, putative [Paecilomyces variotii No. 5]|uniref:Protein-S-isoprenylcysteine O-methyltransferase n=1 Tax=Byssochlamys spectabilis (strain No. 5 / NBRC 109023) TaxID=1356009 RepID=V5FSJ6_BYSSN|nr:prenyl cysteine carboxyl methyltransferase, putative [Paecilomyces variotii No. 5]